MTAYIVLLVLAGVIGTLIAPHFWDWWDTRR
jgi:hypothetical protein